MLSGVGVSSMIKYGRALTDAQAEVALLAALTVALEGDNNQSNGRSASSSRSISSCGYVKVVLGLAAGVPPNRFCYQ